MKIATALAAIVALFFSVFGVAKETRDESAIIADCRDSVKFADFVDCSCFAGEYLGAQAELDGDGNPAQLYDRIVLAQRLCPNSAGLKSHAMKTCTEYAGYYAANSNKEAICDCVANKFVKSYLENQKLNYRNADRLIYTHFKTCK